MGETEKGKHFKTMDGVIDHLHWEKVKKLGAEIKNLQQQNAILLEGLEFYGDKDNYDGWNAMEENEGGNIARTAIEKADKLK